MTSPPPKPAVTNRTEDTPPIVVIGGGPAGSTVATLLVQRGFSVHLFEHSKFPRQHIGESLLPATLATLELTGVLDKVRDAGFVDKAGATMIWGQSREPWTWYFRETNKRFPTSFQVNRPEFDQILLHHAQESGVVVHQETKVDEVVFDQERCIGVGIDGNTVEAAFVIDASGQKSMLATQLRIREWDEKFRNLAVYGYFRGARHLEGEDAGNILIESVPSGWLWKIPLKNDVSSIGLVADRDSSLADIRKAGLSDFFHTGIRESKWVSDLVADESLIDGPTATRDWSYQASRFAGDGWVLVGDAACFIDPLFSTGVHLAVSGAFIAAAYVTTALTNAPLGIEAAEAYDRLYRRQYMDFRDITQLCYYGNRVVDSDFWDSRKFGERFPYLPREQFIRTVSGQNVAGYERSLLSQVELPPEFQTALNDYVESATDSINTMDDRILLNQVAIASPEVEVAQSVVFEETEFRKATVLRGVGRDELPISEFVAELLRSCKNPVPVHQVIRNLPKLSGSDPEYVRRLTLQALRLLVQDRAIRLVERAN